MQLKLLENLTMCMGRKALCKYGIGKKKKPLQIYTGLHALTYSEHAQSTL